MTELVLDVRALHTCWTRPDWKGVMMDDCPGCDVAIEFPCQWCGYGAVFTTHNDLAHAENGDPFIGEADDWPADWFNLPYRDWSAMSKGSDV
jgi:hypothetical protein